MMSSKKNAIFAQNLLLCSRTIHAQNANRTHIITKPHLNVNIAQPKETITKLKKFVSARKGYSGLMKNALSAITQITLIWTKKSANHVRKIKFMTYNKVNVLIVRSKNLNLMEKSVSLVPFQHTGIKRPKIVWLAILDKTTIQKLQNVNAQ